MSLGVPSDYNSVLSLSCGSAPYCPIGLLDIVENRLLPFFVLLVLGLGNVWFYSLTIK